MSEKFLHRDDAPFTISVWDAIDHAAKNAAAAQMSARRLLHLEGPLGFGLKAIPGPESEIAQESDEELTVSVSPVIPVALISASFSMAARDIDAFERDGFQMDLRNAVDAARKCAAKEDQLLFYGSKALGGSGLLNAKGVQQYELQEWKEPGAAVEDVIAAVSRLDAAGFHGPFSLALSPGLYNQLFRRYPQGNTLEIEHLKELVTDGIVKAPSVKSGGVLIAPGRQYASIVLGQDLLTGFEGPEGRTYAFFISESVALRISAPESICVLKAKA